MSQDLVLYETDAKVGFVTLNRPEKLNALSVDLRRELAATLTRADEDPATSVVVLRGAGRSFCVGYDLASGSGSEAWRHDALKYHERLGTSLALELMPWYMRKPVLASVQGHALGAGCELAMFCDLTIAADDAMFGEPEVRYSQAGPGFVMPWIIGFKKARELLYLGDMIDAPTALELGMVNRIVPRDDLSKATLKFARRMTLIVRSARHHQARHQSRCRRRRISQRDAGRHRRGRAALCRADRGRNPVPRARPQGRIGRRVEMAQGSVRNLIAKD